MTASRDPDLPGPAPTTPTTIQALRQAGELAAARAAALACLPQLAGAERAAMLLALSQVHAAGGEVLQALRTAVAARDASVAAGQGAGACDALIAMATALRLGGDHAGAISILEQAESLSRELGSDAHRARVLRALGVCSSIVGSHHHALACLSEAVELLADGADPADRLGARSSLLNARSRRIEHVARPDAPGQAQAVQALLQDLATLADDAGAAGLPQLQAMAAGNRAITLATVGRHREAADALQALLPVYRALQLRPNEGLCQGELARCHLALGDFDAACEAATQAIALLDQGGALDDLREACERLSAAEEGRGQSAAALAALKRAREIQRRQSDEQAREAVMQRELRIELARLTSQWARHASQDPLTGLANRRALDDWLRHHWPQVERGEPLTALLMDLDRFKAVNDGFGHAVGDEVLRRVARLIEPLCRAGDLAVRYGGEEFLLLLPGLGGSAGARVAERLRLAVADHDWTEVAAGLRVTVSVGVATATEAGDAQALFTLADRRLYAAKLGGRDRVETCG